MIKQVRHKVKRKIQRFYLFLNSFKPKVLGGAGLYDVLKYFLSAMRDRRFTMAAMAMSFRFFFALFPALILLFTIIPLLPIENLQMEVLAFLGTIVPGDSLGFVEVVVREFFDKPSASLIYINVALMLFSSLGGIKVMIHAFTKENERFRNRQFLRFNAVALAIFISLFMLFLLMLGILISGEYFINYLITEEIIHRGILTIILRTFHLLTTLLSIQVAVSLMYFLGPPHAERWRFFSVGSVTSGILILLAIHGFRFFFENFANYNKVYGSLGAIMVLMVWFYWISVVLLVGFELNNAIAEAKERKMRSSIRFRKTGENRGEPRVVEKEDVTNSKK